MSLIAPVFCERLASTCLRLLFSKTLRQNPRSQLSKPEHFEHSNTAAHSHCNAIVMYIVSMPKRSTVACCLDGDQDIKNVSITILRVLRALQCRFVKRLTKCP